MMKRLFLLLLFLIPIAAFAQVPGVVIVKTTTLKNPTAAQFNLVDYTTSQTAAFVLSAPCAAPGPPEWRFPCGESLVGTAGTLATETPVAGNTVFGIKSGVAAMFDVSTIYSGPTIRTAKLTSNFTHNSVNVANVTGMSFSVVSGHYYKIDCNLSVSISNTTGYKLGVTGPTITQASFLVELPMGTCSITGAAITGSLDCMRQGIIDAMDEAVQNPSVNAADTKESARVAGFILPSADGTWQLQFGAQNGSPTVTMYQGSVCVCIEAQ